MAAEVAHGEDGRAVGECPQRRLWPVRQRERPRLPSLARGQPAQRRLRTHAPLQPLPPNNPSASDRIQAIRDAILEGAPGERIGELPLPDTMRAAVVRKDEVDMFAGLESYKLSAGFRGGNGRV